MSHEKTLDIACVGILVADTMAKPIEKMPAWRQLSLVEQVELHVGGCANNTGTGAALLGMRVGVLGKVGQDGFGDFVLGHLKDEGIDTRGLKRDDKANTSFTFVMIAPDGERAFFHYVGANGEYSYEDVDWNVISESGILHVAGALVMPGLDGEPTARLLKRAKKMGVTTCLDTVWNSSIDGFATLKPSLLYLDYLLPSIDEARLMTGLESPEEVADALLAEGVGTVALKMGAEGSFVKNRVVQAYVPAFKAEVVDTSGAGDAWIAGFLTGVRKSWGLEASARLGNAMGALCVTTIGTTTGLRGWDETVAFMKSAEILETE